MDGALYEFDGEGIEALPFTADTLLSSSFKFSDDSVVVGGKETITYGVSSKTGKVSVALLVERSCWMALSYIDSDTVAETDSDSVHSHCYRV